MYFPFETKPSFHSSNKCSCKEVIPLTDMEQLFQQYSTTVYRLALSCLGSRQDAEDVTQTVFLKALEKMPPLEESRQKAWLCRVTVNQSRDLLRSFWRKNTLPLEPDLPAQDGELHDVFDAVLRLPLKYRVPVHLYYIEGFSTAEIARQLKLTPSAVTTRLQRARTMLKQELEV